MRLLGKIGFSAALLSCGMMAGAQEPAATPQPPAPQKPSSQGNLITGEAKVKVIRSYTGAALPRPPNTIVYDFAIPESAISQDNSLAERLHEHHQSRQGNDSDTSPATIAAELNDIFSKTLVGELQKATQPVARAATADAPPPQHSLVVRGEFTGVSQGDRGKRILIGLGRGASNVEAHVTVTLLNESQQIVLSEFTLKSGSGKKPGAAETMGVGGIAVGAATGSVSDKKETIEADTRRMAQAVAKEISQIMASQQWVHQQR
ncbi:DUF4410 domain-containing protein [Granulicella sp. dw_53]|uniref:DUF4410 domain-containing protein n=1 Tax=Granulicella sp. dw_53 TaxID=2719792 RepID=UPI001BD49DB5|nr:DUF4410 domain-containing protein [Granulicella sp. dw_53]